MTTTTLQEVIIANFGTPWYDHFGMLPYVVLLIGGAICLLLTALLIATIKN